MGASALARPEVDPTLFFHGNGNIFSMHAQGSPFSACTEHVGCAGSCSTEAGCSGGEHGQLGKESGLMASWHNCGGSEMYDVLLG